MRQLTVILTALTVATFQTHAGRLDWLFDVANNDNMARTQAQSLVGWCVASPLSAFREGRDCRQRLAFLSLSRCNHGSGAGVERDRSSYLVCFKLTERITEFHIVTVIQYASTPPTEQEITMDKRLNRWPMSPPWKAGVDLPHNIKPPGLNVVLDMCRAGSNR